MSDTSPDGENGAYIHNIQPTMIRLVTLLRSWGYHTSDSGDGRLNIEAGMEGAIPFPHVIMRLTERQQDPMLAKDTLATFLHEAVGQRLRDEVDHHVEVSYSTQDGQWIIGLYGVTDADLKDDI